MKRVRFGIFGGVLRCNVIAAEPLDEAAPEIVKAGAEGIVAECPTATHNMCSPAAGDWS